MDKKRIAVFLSGRGSNFKAILDALNQGSIHGDIVAVISDNSKAHGLSYARESGIEDVTFTKDRAESRSDYFQRIVDYLDEKRVNLVVLAGFMKILSSNIVKQYKNRILNIHPALLPSFPGLHAQKQALEHGVKYSGCTVHFVDKGVDTGPIVLQEVVPVLDYDTEESLSERILKKEHIIYPLAVSLFCDDRIVIKGRRVFVKRISTL